MRDVSVYASEPGQPRASVIVNNHNYARFLQRSIESALAQTYSRLEVIVVDDGSDDDSVSVIAGFGDRIVPVLKGNAGQASAFNAGFRVSHGEIVVFLDADDELMPTAIERAARELTSEVSKVHWFLKEVNAAGAANGKLQPEGALGEGDFRLATVAGGPIAGNSPPTSGNAWARWFLDSVFPIPEDEFRINADGYLITLAWLYGEVRAIPECLGYYRVHGSNRYAASSSEQKMQRHLEKFLFQCEALEAHAQKLGYAPDTAIWKSNKGLVDPGDERHARCELSRVAPPGAVVILVDDSAFAPWSRYAELEERKFLPFLEREGIHWGRPLNAGVAIGELERLRGDGAHFIAFPWLTFWWLDYYAAFAAHLRARYPCVLESKRIVVFDLRATVAGEAAPETDA